MITVMESIFKCESVSDLDAISEKILNELSGQRIIAFHGGMGSGKTTLIKAICKNLSITDDITSPTFAIMNEYAFNDEPVYHFDFYRINSESEAFDLGYENFFYSGNYCFIEWAEKIKNLLPAEHAEIFISEIDGARQIKLTV